MAASPSPFAFASTKFVAPPAFASPSQFAVPTMSVPTPTALVPYCPLFVPPAPLARSFAGVFDEGTVRILVGGDEKPFDIHRKLFTSLSSFFRKSLPTLVDQAKDGIVRFPEDDPSTFELLASWIYGVNALGGVKEYMMLFDLWILADKFGVPDLQNGIVRRILDFPLRVPLMAEDISLAYSKTSQGSKLRVLTVSLHMAFSTTLLAPLAITSHNQEFLYDLCVAQAEKLRNPSTLDKVIFSPDRFYVRPETEQNANGKRSMEIIELDGDKSKKSHKPSTG